MLSYFDLRRGVQFVLDGQPYEVLEFRQMGKSQDVVVAQTKIRNLITRNVLTRNFHQGDRFEEAEIEKKPAKFIYGHRDKFVFCEANNPSKRFELSQEVLGDAPRFLKSNQEVGLLIFRDQVINVALPIKVTLRVAEAPPNTRGDTAQGGTKPVTLETGAMVNTPLFIENGDTIEVNTETGEYARRIEKAK
ncbi:MAG: elongation factor P [Candidatus Spechtbacterales bacterium]